jgi:galactokinase/galactose-1-phosphate uridylyltransferase (family 1)
VSELRWHPLLEQWVATATHRQDRTFLPPDGYCPLCPTRPGGFPSEIPSDDFDIVVFENKFPSLRSPPPPPAVEGTPLTPVQPAAGICEVVVYSPDHRGALASMPLDRIRHLIWVWRDRYLELGQNPLIRYVMIFENRGEAVGVTLHHPHGQIYAFPFIPPIPEKELAAARAHRTRTGRCLFCDLVAEERADGRRLILEGERFLAYVPFHARYPYETYLAPKAHQRSMVEWTPADVDDLAAVLKGLLLKFDALFAKPFPYMMVVHQAPTGGSDEEAHLHFEFYSPLRTATRLKYLAGCESGAGTFINDTLAEESAAALRAVGPQSVAAVRAPERFEPASSGPTRSAEALRAAFGPGGEVVTAFAPGRVNLIGEHTDYNEGFVLPMAIEAGIELSARLRPGHEVRVRSVDFEDSVTFLADGSLEPDQAHPWSNYVRGVVWALRRAGLAVGGMDLAFTGTLAQGAGLSSSAALEVATALAAQALFGLELELPRLARLCQEAENDFVGMKCGIMDQFASLAGQRGQALFLDCRSLATEHVPLALGDHLVAICHSGVRHVLVGSGYNTRRQECATGVEALASRFPAVRALRDATLSQLEACRDLVDSTVWRRCRHIITENARVLLAVQALRAGDLVAFGRLMDESHASQRDDFEVSCPEVDRLVDLARRTDGVLGSRITGGGFGGCTVNLVHRDALPALREVVLPEYQRLTGQVPRLFVSTAAGGARMVRR